MTQITTVFRISVFGMCSLASLMIAVADESLFPQALTVPLAIVAFFFVERWKSFHLSVFWANTLGALAFVYTFLRMSPLVLRLIAGKGIPEEGLANEIIVSGHMLVFLTWVVFFQRKTLRQYWFLCTLSVLQAALGAILSSKGAYGALLIAYMFLSIWTLSLFSLEQAQLQLVHAEADASALLPAAAVAYADLHAKSAVPTAIPREWTAILRRAGTAFPAIQIDPHERWLSARFVGGVIGVTCLSLVVATGFVIFTPRVWVRAQPIFPSSGDSGALSGFTETVDLSSNSIIRESTAHVLDVKIVNAQTGERLDVQKYAADLGLAEPLFRGAVMEIYKDKRWSSRPEYQYNNDRTRTNETGEIIQKIRMQPIHTSVMPAITPNTGCDLQYQNSAVYYNWCSNVFYWEDGKDTAKPFEYTVYASAPSRPNKRAHVAVRAASVSSASNRLGRRDYFVMHTRLPGNELTELKRIANEIADQSVRAGRGSKLDVALRMEAYLQDTGRFRYSLEPRTVDPSLDPVEDFLLNTRSGHCEYFASTLALMLRAASIPSRLISGFKGGNVNAFSGNYEVQQRHAHAWVEALIDGEWITLDPTPADERQRSVSSLAPRMLTWHDFQTLVRDFWSNRIVNVNLNQQTNDIYRPIANTLQEWWNTVRTEGGGWTAFGRIIVEFIKSPDQWLSWKGTLLTTILLAAIGLVGWVCWLLIKPLRRLFKKLSVLQNMQTTRIEFYERFARICKSCGLVRGAAQTQREFANVVHRTLSQLLESHGLAAFPRDLVDAFYHIRFGNHRLEPELARQIDHRLVELEKIIKTRPA